MRELIITLCVSVHISNQTYSINISTHSYLLSILILKCPDHLFSQAVSSKFWPPIPDPFDLFKELTLTSYFKQAASCRAQILFKHYAFKLPPL